MNKKSTHGISDSDLNDILTALQKNKNITEVILFGSRAKGTFSIGSDIDLALKGPNLGLSDLNDAKIEIDKLLIPNKIDLIIYNRITDPDLTEHINRVGIVLFKR